jgi:ABC-2 type transport system permease protein
MVRAGRYVRLLLALGRYGLARELAFRSNFLVKLTVEVIWLGILLLFYRTVFSKTRIVADWPESHYLFFLGCYFALEGLIETFFLENCAEFSELVRTGDLDYILLKPIDEQFLVSCRKIDWSTAANFFLGTAVMIAALIQMDWAFDPWRALLFVLLFTCGLLTAYSFLLMLTATSVWLVRNQNLMEMWWLFTSLMRYPKDIWIGQWVAPLGWFFSWVVPVLLVIYVPSGVIVNRLRDPWIVVYAIVATGVLLVASRQFFRFALRRYRSASS